MKKLKVPRFHLFEFEDLRWLPKFLRGYITDLLTYQIVDFGIYKSAIPKIAEVLDKSGQDTLVDLCSGSGGPSPGIIEELSLMLKKNISLFLTDKFPNKKAFLRMKSSSVTPVLESVDAQSVPIHLDLIGMRTLFTSFHHFKPKKAQKILQDSVNKQMPIGIFEITERKLGSLLTLFIAPITCLIFSLFIRPRKIGRFFWTYVIPIVPILYTWDGLISNLRTYSKNELIKMTSDIETGESSYHWETGELISRFHIKVNYLIGCPK
ncbi:hypothetical protein [Candidatus Neptunichlamydia sp. REUL1]|uniref:hypothetical protein n=1 Tax=Candidatus Neptunichlamydia sp. REUL1 TaxID=3064277 RepID=UPI0029306A50|nr:hypothetical protein [Candidatus Neptunochlamydia sp. REUL1]